MMKGTIRQAMIEDEDELNDLFETNKTLASEKKELHRQKLRSYS